MTRGLDGCLGTACGGGARLGRQLRQHAGGDARPDRHADQEEEREKKEMKRKRKKKKKKDKRKEKIEKELGSSSLRNGVRWIKALNR